MLQLAAAMWQCTNLFYNVAKPTFKDLRTTFLYDTE